MNSDLPATGTVALLELLDPFVPDDLINQAWTYGRTGGRHREHTAAQLFRVHLLSLLSLVHSLNLLIKMLPEQRAWRAFAVLRCQSRVPERGCCICHPLTDSKRFAHKRGFVGHFSTMSWKRLLAHITGSVDQELLLRNEYLVLHTGVSRSIRHNPYRRRKRSTELMPCKESKASPTHSA